jgi:hypothetical protein
VFKGEKQMRMTHGKAMVLLLVLAAGACGDDGDEKSKPSEGGTGNVDTPAYLAATRVFADNGGSTTYMQVLRSIEDGAKLELSKAHEFAGSAELFNLEGIGWFGVGSGEAPVLTQYGLSKGGALEEKKKLNLANYGVQDFFADDMYFVSATKVYYPDSDGKQLIVINPTAMTVDGVVALPETGREGYTAVYSYTAVKRGDKLLFSVGWFDWTNDKILPETGLVVLDTKSDEVVRFDVDKRCGGITQSVMLASGEAYFASSALAGALYKIGTYPLAPCALRVESNADAFDTDYLLKLAELTGGAIAGEPIRAGDDRIFLRVLDDGMVTVEADTASWEITGTSAWRWAAWEVSEEKLTELDLPPSTADVLSFEVDGRVFAGQTTPEYESTKLIDLTAEGGPRPALESPGFLSGLAKIR